MDNTELPPERPTLEHVPSRMSEFSRGLKLDVRAHQRTYEGAYTRTAIVCLSFSILIVKLFSKEFLPIGAIYTIYGTILYFMGVKKARQVDFFYNPDRDKEYYTTSGNSVVFLTVVSLATYISLLVLILRM